MNDTTSVIQRLLAADPLRGPLLREIVRTLERAPHWFRDAGLEHVQVHTYVGTIQAPLNDALRLALLDLFAMLWGQPQPGVSPQDWIVDQRYGRGAHLLACAPAHALHPGGRAGQLVAPVRGSLAVERQLTNDHQLANT